MEKGIAISIIIPTLNEEKYLGKLLESIKKQAYRDYEIIVSDNNSEDRTQKIAKEFGCKVVKGDGNPGVGRNSGAKAAKGNILFFIDADCCIEKDFLQRALNEIKKRNLDIAGCCVWPISKRFFDNAIFAFFNFWIYLTQFFYPNASGSGIFCRKSLHQKIKGFDGKIKLSEDMDYAKRASKYGKFKILSGIKVYTSVRRFDEEGRLALTLKLFLSAAYRIIFGEIKTNIFKYGFRYKK